MKNIFAVLGLVFVCFLFQNCNAQVSTNNLKLDDFIKTYQSKKNAILVDVRTPEEWAKGKISTAKLIDFKSDSFLADMAKLDKTKPIFLFCAAGVRSSGAAQKLIAAGFKDVYSLSNDGYSGLAKKGLK